MLLDVSSVAEWDILTSDNQSVKVIDLKPLGERRGTPWTGRQPGQHLYVSL